MPPFTPVSIIRLLGVILGAAFLQHLYPSPWWIVGAASLACLFLP